MDSGVLGVCPPGRVPLQVDLADAAGPHPLYGGHLVAGSQARHAVMSGHLIPGQGWREQLAVLLLQHPDGHRHYRVVS